MSKVIDLIEVEKGVYEFPKEKEYHFSYDFAAKNSVDAYIEALIYLHESGQIEIKKVFNGRKKN